MSSISEIRINSILYDESINIYVPHNPIIIWEYDDDIGTSHQNNIQIKISSDNNNWGTDSFSDEILSINEPYSGNTWTISNIQIQRGETYYGQIRGQDEEGNLTDWSVFHFQINRLPFVTDFYLIPEQPFVYNDIDLIYTFNDPDGHLQSGTMIRWFKNNLPVTKYDNLCTLPASATSIGESWTAKIIPSDGIEFGTISETTSVVIQSADFGFDFVEILPADANVDDILMANWSLSENEYVNIEDVLIKWYVNNQLVSDDNKQIIRLSLLPGDEVKVEIVALDNSIEVAQSTSDPIVIQDVNWHIEDIEVSGLSDAFNVPSLTPIIDWKIQKTTAIKNQTPKYTRILITKTKSMSGPVFDTGIFEYVKNSYNIPENVLLRGQKYFIHIGVGDSDSLSDALFETKEIQISGSSWESNVKNEIGWTVEFNVYLDSSSNANSNLGVYIHDGTYFCSFSVFLNQVSFSSVETISYNIRSGPDMRTPRTFKISAKNQDVRIFMNNVMIIDGVGVLQNLSNLKRIEFGDLDGKHISGGTFRFFRYSTIGAYGLDENAENIDTMYFSNLGQIENGSIEYVFDNIVAWLPDDDAESSKLYQINNNTSKFRLSTVTRNFSPINKIVIDKNRNKFLATANGVVAIYGEKHEPDFFLDTSEITKILPSQFDLISNVSKDKISQVEATNRTKWFTINTTYRAIGEEDTNTQFDVDDEYFPYIYKINTHAVHYYTQRTHGHTWYDMVDNSNGWQVEFRFLLDALEADDYSDTNTQKSGFGVYVNDGSRQEIIYFYEDKIRLFYANVFVSINTKVDRQYVITGKDNNLKIFQKSQIGGGGHQLLLDGSGLFTTSSSRTGNSRKPKIVQDINGVYHSVWHDDSNKHSQIFYSQYTDSWSTPEIVPGTSTFNARNPSIDTDAAGKVWVVYEDTSWGNTEISVSVRDKFGWNPKTRITNFKSDKANPDIKVDTINDVHVVWEDNRNKHWEILWSQWSNQRKAWLSSGQFGEDTTVMQVDPDDPYQINMDFKKPKISFSHPLLHLVAEGHYKENDYDYSGIYIGFRNISTSVWNSSGAPIIQNNEVVSFGSSQLISPHNRRCTNPSIASSNTFSSVIVVWEDQTEPVYQIWGTSLSDTENIVTEATQITSQIDHCTNPSVGYVYNQAIIVYLKGSSILTSHYNLSFEEFHGSALGGIDQSIELSSDKIPSNPSVPPNIQSKTFTMVYDYSSRRTAELSSVEMSEFQMIGEAIVEHSETYPGSPISTTHTISDGTISILDTKEFAFGDFSDNVGMIANWRDIKMYFGYDSMPMSISKFNSDIYPKWVDNRINDLFIDSYSNMVVATFGGLLYHNVFTGNTVHIKGLNQNNEELLRNKLVTSVEWGKNGVWYVGTTTGLFYSKTAGRFWDELFPSTLSGKIINNISVNSKGEAICAVTGAEFNADSDGIYIVHPDFQSPKFIKTNTEIKIVKIDENNIIWAGGHSGLLRIENENIIFFNKNTGMKSSHVNDITIVNKHLRYIATASGVERMHGMKFTNFNTKTHNIINNNISSVNYNKETNSLWIASLYQLHEIVFRDPFYDIILDEVSYYDDSEIGTKKIYDSNSYIILDYNLLRLPDGTSLSNKSSSVFINNNKVNFGYVIDESSQAIIFETDLLVRDKVDVEISNQFLQVHNFNQNKIEKSVKGELRQSIHKIDQTNKGQLLLLSGSDKPGILLFNEQQLGLPFTTIMLDRDPPLGCIQKLETITRSIIRFRILAFDNLSGIDGYILSNYENFTSDGTTDLEFQPLTNSTVQHDIGSNLNNVFDSLEFPSTVVIEAQTYNVGAGTVMGKWNNESQTQFLYAATSNPCVIFRYDPASNQWAGIRAINPLDSNTYATDMKTFFNVIYLATGTSSVGGNGAIYKSVNGTDFTLVGNVTGAYVRGIVATSDGTILFGSSDGKIYQLRNNILSVKYENIGQSILTLGISEDILIAGTGSQGRLYSINLQTDDNLIMFNVPGTFVNKVLIDEENGFVFATDTEMTTIYRGDLEDFDFVKSYSSFNQEIRSITMVESNTLLDETEHGQNQGQNEHTVIVAVGQNLFKYKSPSWEFVYRHDEVISDIVEFSSSGVTGIWIVSDNKVTKWTASFTEKTVYLKLKDKAGNVSALPIKGCPAESENTCCNFAYSLKIADLKGFVNENRIVDITENGNIVFTYDAPNNRPFFSANQIDEESGIYTSEIFNGSNNLVSWRTISWESTEPEGTSVDVQIRSGPSLESVSSSTWSHNLVKNGMNASIEHITDQYIQFRAILKSRIRDVSPTLTSVTLKNLTSQASHFFTTNFIVPSRPIKGILTANTFVPVSADIVFGINTHDSVDFGDYQIIEPNRLFTTSQGQFGSNIRIGAKLLSPGSYNISPSNNPDDPYDAFSYICNIEFEYTNDSGNDNDFHFRIQFYNDPFRTQLIHTFFTGNDQTHWFHEYENNTFPSGGVFIENGNTKTIIMVPELSVSQNQKWYVSADAWNGSEFTNIFSNMSYICSSCNVDHIPGLIAEYYKSSFSSPVLTMPDFSKHTPDHTCIESEINFPLTQGIWESSSCGTLLGYTNNFAIKFRGRIYAPVSGMYTFVLESDDGSKLFIDKEEIINMNQIQALTEQSANIELNEGFHDIDIEYFENVLDAALFLKWIIPGETVPVIVPSENLYHTVVSEYCYEVQTPRLLNFAMLFELENGETVKINLN